MEPNEKVIKLATRKYGFNNDVALLSKQEIEQRIKSLPEGDSFGAALNVAFALNLTAYQNAERELEGEDLKHEKE